MKFAGALVRRMKTFSLLRINVQDGRVIQMIHRLEQFYERTDVVASDRTEVWNMQALEHLTGR